MLLLVVIMVVLDTVSSGAVATGTGGFVHFIATPSDNIQQLLDAAVADSSNQMIVVELLSGFFRIPCIRIGDGLRANISVIGQGALTTIVDCGGSASRCLEITDGTSNSNNIQKQTISISIRDIQFRNGVAFSQTPAISSTHSSPSSQRKKSLPSKRYNDDLAAIPLMSVSAKVYLSRDGSLISKNIIRFRRKKKRKIAEKFAPKQATSQQPASSSYAAAGCGGNILIQLIQSNIAVELSNVVVSNGRASLLGGGLAVVDSSLRQLSVSNCTFTRNNVTAINPPLSDDWSYPMFGGGGCWLSNVTTTEGILLQNNSFSNNIVVFSHLSDKNTPGMSIVAAGGGICITRCFGLVAIRGSTILSNVIHSVVVLSPQEQDSYGAAISVSAVDNLQIFGPLFCTANVISLDSSVGSSYLVGAGISLIACNNATIASGPLEIVLTNNSLTSGSRTGSVFLYTGGLYVERCNGVKMTGSIRTSDNSVWAVGSNVQLNAGGMMLTGSADMTIDGQLDVSRNSLSILGTGGSTIAGGIFIHSCNRLRIYGRIQVIGNAMYGSSSTDSYGGGIYIFFGKEIAIDGWVSISQNSIIHSLVSQISNAPYIPPSPSADPGYKCGTLTITSTSGFINDGINGNYPPNMLCTWLVSPPKTTQAFHSFIITFTEFNVYPCNDFVYIYDGPSSFSPLIGKLSGFAESTDPCKFNDPKLNAPIPTSAGQFFVVFATHIGDKQGQYKGFNLSFALVPANRSSGTNGIILNEYNNYPSTAIGSGVCIDSSSKVSFRNTTFSNNVLKGMFFVLGGAVVVLSSTDIDIHQSHFVENCVIGINAGGGALAVLMDSISSCEDCVFQGNAAVAQNLVGWCFYTSESLTLCPTAYGGAAFVAFNSVLNMKNSKLLSGSAYCISDTLPCSSIGGGIAIFQGRLDLQQSSCMGCSSSCSSEATCVTPKGGCLYAYNSNLNVSSSSLLSNSVDQSSGAGGGFCSAGFTTANIVACNFENNLGVYGAALSLVDSTTTFIKASTIHNNSAVLIAGAILMRDNGKLFIDAAVFDSNIASRANTILAYNDNGLGLYKLTNSFCRVALGSGWLILGYLELNNNTVNCSHPGTVFQQDLTPEFFSLTCVACDGGTYALDAASTLYVDRKCATCPFGGRCLGSDSASNGLYALTDYWGRDDGEGNVVFHVCPSGYCCPLGSNCTFDHCEGDRVGLLCGRCKDGSGMRFFTDGCKSDDKCNDAVWFGIVIVVCGIVGVIFLLKTTGPDSAGLLSVLLYFYQMLPLIKSTSWKHTSPTLIIIIQSVFNFSPSGSSSDSNGVCLVRGMTTSQKLGSKMLLQAVIFSIILAVYWIHWIASKVQLPKIAVYRPKRAHYIATGIRFCTIAYTTLLLVSLQMIQCVYFANEYVWWWDGGIQCYEKWQKAGFVAIGCLIPLPFLVILLLWKNWRSETDIQDPWKVEIYRVLSNGFKKERRWWLGVSLYRRLMIVVVYSTIMDGNWRAMATSGLCVVFLVLNLVLKPFKQSLTHKSETTSLTMLALLAISQSPQLSIMQFATSEPIFAENVLEWIQFIMAATPIVAYALLQLHYYLFIMIRRQKPEAEMVATSVETDYIDYVECEMCKMNNGFNNDCRLMHHCC